MNKTELWNKLSHAQLIQGEQASEIDLESPWFVKILLGFSGWLAALFLLLFMGLFFSFVFEQALSNSAFYTSYFCCHFSGSNLSYFNE